MDPTLEITRFDTIFRKLIEVCCNTTSFSVLVEGSLSDLFKAKRELHQGDTIDLSPLIHLHPWMPTPTTCFFFVGQMRNHFTNFSGQLCINFSGLTVNPNKSYITFSKLIQNKAKLVVILGLQSKERATGKSLDLKFGMWTYNRFTTNPSCETEWS